jgi:hypothetical protein
MPTAKDGRVTHSPMMDTIPFIVIQHQLFNTK